MSITLRQIADEAAVSISTVSRVLNGYQFVDDKTRLSVMAVAQQLGYPALKTENRIQNQTVLFLVRDFELDKPSDRMNMGSGREFERLVGLGAQSVLEQHNINARLERTRMQVDDAENYLNDPTLAGLIIEGGIINHDFIQKLLDSGIRFIIIGAHVRPLEVNCIMADYRTGMEQIVNHLAEMGCHQIGVVNGSEMTNSSQEKYKGFRYALAETNLPFVPGQVIAGDFSAESGFEQTLVLLKANPRLDAIIYADDLMALGGMRAIRSTGRRIPEDVSVVGFHDYEASRYAEPSLSSVFFDVRKMGEMGARRLLQLLNEVDDDPWLALVKTTLIVRESSSYKRT